MVTIPEEEIKKERKAQSTPQRHQLYHNKTQPPKQLPTKRRRVSTGMVLDRSFPGELNIVSAALKFQRDSQSNQNRSTQPEHAPAISNHGYTTSSAHYRLPPKNTKKHRQPLRSKGTAKAIAASSRSMSTSRSSSFLSNGATCQDSI